MTLQRKEKYIQISSELGVAFGSMGLLFQNLKGHIAFSHDVLINNNLVFSPLNIDTNYYTEY